ncbi:MAG: hypothetical protein KDC38_17130 [Planctomycetes bacterium]|nr:hypothetical protein [Planctomycetota bacterium]
MILLARGSFPRSLCLGCVLLAGALLPWSSLNAQTYSITEGLASTGCLPPCLCPLLQLGVPTGTFELQGTGSSGGVEFYALTNVELSILGDGDPIELIGSGTWSLDTTVGVQEATLDLTFVGTGETLALASDGAVPLDPMHPFPSIALELATTFTCSGTQLQFVALPSGAAPSFVRADCNSDGVLDISDAIRVLNLLFVAPDLACLNACDANDDETFDISDAITQLSALFTSGSPPAPPFPDCGEDPTAGSLSCDQYTACP